LIEEAAELAAGRVQGALCFLGIAAMNQRPALVVKEIKQHALDRYFSQSRIFVEIADDLSAQHPQVVNVFANGLPGKPGRNQMFQEWPEASNEFFSRRQVFFESHPRAGPLGEVAAVAG
jgi:hypothetical protein